MSITSGLSNVVIPEAAAHLVPDRTPFCNPIWHALCTRHAHLVTCRQGKAMRYPSEVLRFGALEEDTPEAMQNLHALLDPGESIYLFSIESASGTSPALVPGLVHDWTLPGLQMIAPANTPLPAIDPAISISPLTVEDVPAMLALIDVAFPGYFFRRTIELGSYYGVWQGGELIAMGGERLSFGRYVEISAVCTHPEHTGRGYAAAIIARLMHDHRAAGRQSFLHLASQNTRALALYRRLGFIPHRVLDFQRFLRTVD